MAQRLAVDALSVVGARDEALRMADELPFGRWLQQQRDPAFRAKTNLEMAERVEKFPGGEEMGRLYRSFAGDYLRAPPWSFDPSKQEWPENPLKPRSIGDLCTLSELTDEYKQAVVEQAAILFVPTSRCWEVPAYVLFGSFNDCPAPGVHVAMIKWLDERYGCRLVAIGNGMIEVIVSRRPASKEEALWLAADFQTYAEAFLGFAYNGQKAGDIAAYVLESNQWAFWWD